MKSPRLTEQLQAQPASLPQDMTADLHGTMSDHVLVFRLIVLKEQFQSRGQCFNMQGSSMFTHIQAYHLLHVATSVQLPTLTILLRNVAAARNPLSMQPSNKGYTVCTAHLQFSNSCK